MARRLRYHYPGATYHVMLRGNNGQPVFASDNERCKFCLLMQEGIERYEHRILAFCFMTNHIHLAVQVNQVSLSKIFQNLLFRYTRFYNWRNEAIGHLFQGRFKSVLVDSDRYLRELIRYIHLNPVRAKIIDNPLNYRWSSHQAYLMLEEFTWLARNEGLRHFGDTHSEAVEAFNDFVLAGIGVEDNIDYESGCSNGFLGDDEFIERASERFETSGKEPTLITDFGALLSLISKRYDVDPGTLQRPGMDRRSTHIRSVMALLARDAEGITLQELADFCGRGASGISKAASRLEFRMRTSDALKNEVDNLMSELVS